MAPGNVCSAGSAVGDQWYRGGIVRCHMVAGLVVVAYLGIRRLRNRCAPGDNALLCASYIVIKILKIDRWIDRFDK